MRDDRYNYRLAFIEAFRQRGIIPYNVDLPDVESLSVETLQWRGIDLSGLPRAGRDRFRALVARLKRYADACFYQENRENLFKITRRYCHALQEPLAALLQVLAQRPPEEKGAFTQLFGLDVDLPVEVHELRRAIRIGPSGSYLPQIMVALTQARPFRQPGAAAGQVFRGGATLVVDLTQPAVKYAIFKNIASDRREARTWDFLRFLAADPWRAALFNPQEPFAALHTGSDGSL